VSDEPAAGKAQAPAATADEPAAPALAQAQPSAEQAQEPPAEPADASPLSDPRLPWEGKPRRVDLLCWGAITLSGLYYLALLPFRAALVGTHPVIGVLLNGATESIVSAAAFARIGHGSLVIVLLASIPGLMKFDLIYWWAGRLWGERIIHVFGGQRERQRRRNDKFIARVNRWGRWFTWPAVVLADFLPLPSAIIYAVAGWTGMRWVTFLILDAVGSLAWAGLLAGLGYALGQHAVSVAQTVSKYGLWVSIAIVILIVAGQMRSARMRR